MSDQEIQKLESQFPGIAGQAFAAARQKVLSAGQAVMQSENGFLIRVFPDGRKERIKPIPLPVSIQAGTVLSIR